MSLTDAELDDIQRDAESTARLVGAPGSPVRLRAEATVRLVAEVRRLRRVEEAARAALETLRDSDDPGGAAPVIACSDAATILAQALAAGGDP